ncbi:hypothetical protein Tco_1214480 [Tanacetum coccineum]
MLCKQAKKGVPLQAEHADWLEDTDEKIDEQELEAHYSYMAKIQEDPIVDSETNTEPLEQGDSNTIPDSPYMCDNDIQTDQNAQDERAVLANLIANLTLDTEENKNILKQLRKANASLTQELKECKSNLEEFNTTRDSCLIALQTKQTKLETYMTLNDRTIDYEKLEQKHDELVKQSLLTKSHYKGLVKEKTKVITDLKSKEEKDIVKMISMEKQLNFLNEIVYKRNKSIQAIHMLALKGSIFNEKHSHDHFRAPTAHGMEILIKTCLMHLAIKTQNDSFTFVYELKQEMHADLKYVESFENEIDELESDKAEFSNMYDLLLQECMSNDVLCSYLHSLSGLNAHTELQCLYLHKVKECECLAQKLSKKPETN